MRYDDARSAPKTAEDHEKDAYGSTRLTAAEARMILSAHKVPGRSKLDADAARDVAAEGLRMLRGNGTAGLAGTAA